MENLVFIDSTQVHCLTSISAESLAVRSHFPHLYTRAFGSMDYSAYPTSVTNQEHRVPAEQESLPISCRFNISDSSNKHGLVHICSAIRPGLCLEPISGSKIPQAVNIDSLVLQPESFRYFRITSLLRGNSANDNRPFYCHQGFSNLQMPVPSDLNAPPSLPAPPVHVLTCASRK